MTETQSTSKAQSTGRPVDCEHGFRRPFRVGDTARAIDFRSEHYRETGEVIEASHGCITVRFTGCRHHKPGTEGTGVQWFRRVAAPAEAAAYEAAAAAWI